MELNRRATEGVVRVQRKQSLERVIMILIALLIMLVVSYIIIDVFVPIAPASAYCDSPECWKPGITPTPTTAVVYSCYFPLVVVTDCGWLPCFEPGSHK